MEKKYLSPLVSTLPNPARRNKSISRRLLVRVQSALLEFMNEHGDTYIPPELRDLTDRAGLTRQTFYGNFADLNAVFYWSIFCLSEDLKKSLEKKPIRGDLETAFFWTFKFLYNNPVQLEFCLRRFDGKIWSRVLAPLEKLIKATWLMYGPTTTEYLYQFFCVEFREVLFLWRDADFSWDFVEPMTTLLFSFLKSPNPALVRRFLLLSINGH